MNVKNYSLKVELEYIKNIIQNNDRSMDLDKIEIKINIVQKNDSLEDLDKREIKVNIVKTNYHPLLRRNPLEEEVKNNVAKGRR